MIHAVRDYLGPEAQGLPNEAVVHKGMWKALDDQRLLSELKPKDFAHEELEHR